jgi:hypothetical protein
LTSASDDNGIPLAAPVAPPETLLIVVDGLGTTWTVATSTIDVEATPSRGMFVDETGIPDDTDLLISRVSNLRVDPSLAEYGFLLNNLDTYRLSITRPDTNGVLIGRNGVQWGTVGNVWSTSNNATTWRLDGNFGDPAGAALLAGNCQIKINVDGINVLETGLWLLSVSINTDEVADPSPTNQWDQIEVDNENSHNWDINGCQFVVPYLHRNTATYGTQLVISNINANDAEIYADVYTDGGIVDGSGLTSGQRVATALIGVVSGRSTRLLTPAEIETAVNTALGGAAHNRYMARFTVRAPLNDIFVNAFQNQGAAGRRPVPVYTNVGKSNVNINPFTGVGTITGMRQWQE